MNKGRTNEDNRFKTVSGIVALLSIGRLNFYLLPSLLLRLI